MLPCPLPHHPHSRSPSPAGASFPAQRLLWVTFSNPSPLPSLHWRSRPHGAAASSGFDQAALGAVPLAPMAPTRLAECLRARLGDARARALCPPCRTLPGLGAPMGDTRTSRRSCRLGRRASCRQVGAGEHLGRPAGLWGVGAAASRGTGLQGWIPFGWQHQEPLGNPWTRGLSGQEGSDPSSRSAAGATVRLITVALGYVDPPFSSLLFPLSPPLQPSKKLPFSWGLSARREN